MTGGRDRSDLAFGTGFVLLGAGILAAAATFPAGAPGIPGPAVFPAIVGAALVGLGAVLARSASRPDATAAVVWATPTAAHALAAVLLLALYLALWEVVPFAARTAALLVALYRLFGESWRRAALLAAGITLTLHVVFERLLGVRL